MKKLILDKKACQDIIKDFSEKLTKAITDGQKTNGEFIFKYNLSSKLTEHKKLYITPTAWIKMMILINKYSSEIGWYGTAERTEDGQYRITNILVYPQQVSGAAVETDQEEFEKWLHSIDEETYKNLRFNGHSHVNMSVSPSGTDMEGRKSDLKCLRKNDFQIFMILNKSLDHDVAIYDRRDEAVYETDDVDILIEGCDEDTFEVYDSTKNMVKNKWSTWQGNRNTVPTAVNQNKKTPKRRYLYESSPSNEEKDFDDDAWLW